MPHYTFPTRLEGIETILSDIWDRALREFPTRLEGIETIKANRGLVPHSVSDPP